MNVLLTGGAGYIGSHIAVELLESGYDVVIADNFSNSDKGVITAIEKITGKRIDLFEIDVADKVKLNEVFEQTKPEAVIHLAGFKAVGESVSKPLMYYRNNIDCTLSLLEIMEAHNVNKLVFSSSATVYGIGERLPYTEEMLLGEASNPYGATKQMIERIIMDTVSCGWLSAVILRYFNPVGAHQSALIGEKPQGIPNNLMPYIMQVANGSLPELRVYGNDYPTRDGTGVRDYIHVMDLAKGHVDALKYFQDNDGVEVFNLGTGVGYSVLEIVAAFEKANGVKIPYSIVGRRDGDLAEVYADVKKAKNLLGWNAKLTIEDMCKDSYAFALIEKT
ncbi:MAG: UDP-glucose 4-epimerase GalE [Oscillospiraceae bacterium]|nr:UDP-glucose 4-epimerase GalE [Oscillospiraceae bacterium]